MSEHSHIEWTDATWNPVRGCTKITLFFKKHWSDLLRFFVRALQRLQRSRECRRDAAF
jgi:protein gp37